MYVKNLINIYICGQYHLAQVTKLCPRNEDWRIDLLKREITISGQACTTLSFFTNSDELESSWKENKFQKRRLCTNRRLVGGTSEAQCAFYLTYPLGLLNHLLLSISSFWQSKHRFGFFVLSGYFRYNFVGIQQFHKHDDWPWFTPVWGCNETENEKSLGKGQNGKFHAKKSGYRRD